MEAVREAWTDERLDDLNHKVERIDQRVGELSREMHAEFRSVRSEMKSEFQAVRGEMNARFDSMQNQMAAMQNQMTAMQKSMNLMMATMLGGFFTLFASMLATQL